MQIDVVVKYTVSYSYFFRYARRICIFFIQKLTLIIFCNRIAFEAQFSKKRKLETARHYEIITSTMQTEFMTLGPFLLQLSKDTCSSVLPYTLSPLHLVTALVRSNHVMEGAYMYWSILCKPSLLYTDKNAYDALKYNIMNGKLPYVLQALQEVRAGSWSWNMWKNEFENCQENL